ncbi:CHAD domain-containing protein [Gryllotalpicola reticulitermitis]|uniref:CHAD domain-containing protein n=1 Tax=Gryllotalpicola reticulitermitis TaxID=1184153 RepID=A0ABV8Q2H4_9MICO
MGEDSSEGSSVESWLRDTIDTLIGLGTAVRRNEADAVHKARTATRRLRVVLDLVPGEAASHARTELKRYGRLLGTARDFEVRAELAQGLLDAVGDSDETDAAHRRLIEGVRGEYAAAHATVMEYLDGPHYQGLIERLEEVRSGTAGLDELAVQHEARKHARAMRYLAEALGDEQTAVIGAGLQDAFGEQRDYTLLARSLEGDDDASVARIREVAGERGRAMPGGH